MFLQASITSIWRADASDNYASDIAQATSLRLQTRIIFSESGRYSVFIDGQTPIPVLESGKVLRIHDGASKRDAVLIDTDEDGHLIVQVVLVGHDSPIMVDFSFYAKYDAKVDTMANNAPKHIFPWSITPVPSDDAAPSFGDLRNQAEKIATPRQHWARLQEFRGRGCYNDEQADLPGERTA